MFPQYYYMHIYAYFYIVSNLFVLVTSVRILETLFDIHMFPNVFLLKNVYENSRSTCLISIPSSTGRTPATIAFRWPMSSRSHVTCSDGECLVAPSNVLCAIFVRHSCSKHKFIHRSLKNKKNILLISLVAYASETSATAAHTEFERMLKNILCMLYWN